MVSFTYIYISVWTLLTIALIRLYNSLIFRARVLFIAGLVACYSHILAIDI